MAIFNIKAATPRESPEDQWMMGAPPMYCGDERADPSSLSTTSWRMMNDQTPPQALSSDTRATTSIWRAAVLVYLSATVLRTSILGEAVPETTWQVLQFGVIAIGLVAIIVLEPRQGFAARGLKLFHGSVAAFLVFALVSVFFSADRVSSLLQWGIALLMFAFVVWNGRTRWARSPESIRADVRLLVVFFSVVQALGFLLLLVDSERAMGPYSRFIGLFNNASLTGIVSALTLVLLLGLGLSAQTRTEVKLYGGLALPVVAALVMSGSRAPGIACIVGLALLFCSFDRRRNVRALVAIASTVLVLVIVLLPAEEIRNSRAGADSIVATEAPSPTGVDSEVSDDESSDASVAEESFKVIDSRSSGRLGLYRAAVDGWLEKPIFGNGYRSAPDVIGGAQTHNLPLQVLLETGLLGAGAFVGIVIALGVRARPGPVNAALGASMVVILIVELASSSALGWGGPTALYFWTLIVAFFYAPNWRSAPIGAEDARRREEG